MRDFLTVTKALFKANYGMDLKSKQGKKGIVVAAVLVVCLLPTFALLFNMFQTGFAAHTIDLLIMEMGFAMICFLMLWTALFIFPSIFYFSNDLEHLLVLPITPRVIVASKFVIVYVSLLLVSLLGMVPMLIAYISAGNVNILSIVLFIPQILLIGAPTAFVASIFWMIILRLLPFFKNKDRFNMITGILSIGIAVLIGIGSSQLGANVENPMFLMDMLQNNPENLLKIVRIFVNVPFAARSIVEVSFVDFLITLAITLILGVIFVICADRLYLSAARESKVSSAGKKKKVSYRNQGSVSWSYWKVEFLRLVRTPAYMANCVLSALVMPVMFIVMAIVTPGMSEIKEMLTSQAIVVQDLVNLPLILVIAGAAVGFFAGSLNGISATAFSREGKNLDFVKYIPFDFTKQVMIKGSVGTLFSILTCVLMLFSVHMILPYPIWYDLFFLLGSVLTTVLVNAIAIFVDGIHPKTDWEDETSAVKNNMNVVLEFLISWAILAVTVAPFFLFDLMASWEMYSIIMLVIILLITIGFVIITPKVILKHLMQTSK